MPGNVVPVSEAWGVSAVVQKLDYTLSLFSIEDALNMHARGLLLHWIMILAS